MDLLTIAGSHLWLPSWELGGEYWLSWAATYFLNNLTILVSPVAAGISICLLAEMLGKMAATGARFFI